MRLKANHLTILRIILLPIPYFLIFQGTWQRVGALFIIAVLGFTDYFDGILARRYGTTALGKLLDPIADKIFVAVLFLPLVTLKILPLWLIWFIFLREFIVTELRRFTGEGTKVLSVTALAKIKTTLQMVGGGLILITATFPSKLYLEYFLSIFWFLSLVIIIYRYFRYKILSQKVLIFFSFVSFAMLVRYIFNVKYTCLIYGITIMLITLISGFQYIKVSLPLCLKRGYTSIIKLLASIVIPLGVLSLLNYVPQYSSLVLLILCIEFGIQGLDLLALHEGGIDLSWIKRWLVLPSTILVFLLFYTIYRDIALTIKNTLYFILISITVYGLLDIYLNYKLFHVDI